MADSRPRVRGRFAKNEEIEKVADHQVGWIHVSGEEEDDEENWIAFIDSLSSNLINP